jgi:hypothetical protein
LRSDKIPLEKSRDVYRILILGDSFAFGEGVEIEERFDRQLKSLLIRGKRPEIINAGVMGYGTDQEFLYFIHEGLKFNPDLVILMTYENDLEDIILDYNNTRYKPRLVINGNSLNLTGVPVPFTSKLRDYSLIYTFFYTKLIMSFHKNPISNFDDGLRLFLMLRSRISEICQREGITLVNVVFSSLKSLQSQNTMWKQPILDVSSSQTIPAIDLDLLFLNHGNISSLFIDRNVHWNREGSLFVGRFLLEKVQKMIQD